MEDFADIMQRNYQPSDLEDMQPDARAVYERRVEYHQMISNLLENCMIEVDTEKVKEIPNNEEDNEEDEKEQEEEKKEEEKKQEVKTLYDIHFVYRTVEKRLKENP